MAYHQKKQTRLRSLLRTPVVLALLVFVALFLVWETWGLFSKERVAHETAASAQAEEQALEARKADLNQKISRLDTPQGVEAEIRERLGVVKDGEEEVMIVPAGASNTQGVEGEGGLWYTLTHFFKK